MNPVPDGALGENRSKRKHDPKDPGNRSHTPRILTENKMQECALCELTCCLGKFSSTAMQDKTCLLMH